MVVHHGIISYILLIAINAFIRSGGLIVGTVQRKHAHVLYKKTDAGYTRHTDSWVVHINDGHEIASKIAQEHDLINHGQIGDLVDLFYLEHRDNNADVTNKTSRRLRRAARGVHAALAAHPRVLWMEQQRLRRRFKRGYFSDPLYEKQWYLENKGSYPCLRAVSDEEDDDKTQQKHDINVIPVWNRNITGKGVVVTILDDGVEHSHKDLHANFDYEASFDLNSNDMDPMPRYTLNNINNHGTRCAGEVVAIPGNGICGSGVAYNATLGGIRMLDGKITDAIEAKSLSYKPDYIDIYSISWGPSDDGTTVDGPGRLALRALKNGIRRGRNGLGSIFVWATGNGGRYGDYCSCDGYINSPYTIAIGAVDVCGTKPWYAEECPGTLAVTYGSTASGYFDTEISTTDLHGKCTTRHTGSSAAAPLAAGIFALVLEANPKLTWRDLQHLIVRTSKIVSPTDKSWCHNSAGHRVSEKFGFGALDAAALVDAATDDEWKTSPVQKTCRTYKSFVNLALKPKNSVKTTLRTDGCKYMRNCVSKLEHVQVVISLHKDYDRGKLEIILISPKGTRSPLLKRRLRDHSGTGFREWEFLTVFHWDEAPAGRWTLQVIDHSWTGGRLYSWYMKFYGTCVKPPKALPMKREQERDLTVYTTVPLVLILIVIIVLGTKYVPAVVSCFRKRNTQMTGDQDVDPTPL